MTIGDIWDRYPWIKIFWPVIIGGFVALTIILYGIFSLLSDSQKPAQSIIFKESSQSNSSNRKILLVDVSGAVKKPGLYKLETNSRVYDAIQAAEGFSQDADANIIAKQINLAKPITDGIKIYIPFVKDTTTTMENTSYDQTIEPSASNQNININNANQVLLDSLPGIGSVTATKIINGRPYTSIEELIQKKIVSSKVFEQIKGKITVF